MSKPWPKYPIDDSILDDEHDAASDDEWEIEWENECGLARDGQCSQAGTEHCDFECPNRNSDLFVGSAAWHAKRKKKPNR